MSKIEVNTIETTSGSTLTIGKSGDTVTLASGASQSGFKSIEWQSVVTSDTTMVAGRGYFVNTTSGAITMTYWLHQVQAIQLAIKDYTGTFGTNNCTIGRGGSNLNGGANNYVGDTAHLSLTLVYADSTEGWVAVNDNTTSVGPTFIQSQAVLLQHQVILKYTHLILQATLLFLQYQIQLRTQMKFHM